MKTLTPYIAITNYHGIKHNSSNTLEILSYINETEAIKRYRKSHLFPHLIPHSLPNYPSHFYVLHNPASIPVNIFRSIDHALLRLTLYFLLLDAAFNPSSSSIFSVWTFLPWYTLSDMLITSTSSDRRLCIYYASSLEMFLHIRRLLSSCM